MKTYTQIQPIDMNTQPDTTLFLDIETTGLSPEVSTLFLIGCMEIRHSQLYSYQWLADSLEISAEKEILTAFSNFLFDRIEQAPSITLLTYNGQTFDLPFLHSRFLQCHLTNPLEMAQSSILHRDLYRELRVFKNLWPVKNMKLHTLSLWLTGKTTETPSGKMLIRRYSDYIKTKDPDILNLLFKHNLEDLNALSHLTSLYNYIHFFNGQYVLIEQPKLQDQKLVFSLYSKLAFPAPLEYEHFGFHIQLSERNARLTVPVYERGLRYYYHDPKNYVYLPSEDYAVHKSMTAYINKDHWEKAQPENCYTWFSLDTSFMSDTVQHYKYIQMVFQLFGFLRG